MTQWNRVFSLYTGATPVFHFVCLVNPLHDFILLSREDHDRHDVISLDVLALAYSVIALAKEEKGSND